LELVLAIAAGFAVGSGVAWMYLRQERQGAFDRGRGSMETERAVLFERLAGRDAEVGRLEKKVSDLEMSGQANAELNAENARLKAELEAERAMLTEKAERSQSSAGATRECVPVAVRASAPGE